MKLLKYIVPLLFTSSASAQVLPTMPDRPEVWSACGTATASTSNVAIKAAITAGYIYVTSITCASSDAAVATNINFKDGTTTIAVGGVNQMATTSSGAFSASFVVPLRGSKNTAFNFNTVVSVSSVICCGAGYVSAN